MRLIMQELSMIALDEILKQLQEIREQLERIEKKLDK